MAFTVLSLWTVGQRLTQAALNKMVTAIQELQDEVTTGRPQLRVYAPTAVAAGGAIVQYASVRTDTHGGWNGTNKYYTIPKDGMYQISVGYKCDSTPASISHFVGIYSTSATSYMSGPNGTSGAFAGGVIAGSLYLTAGTQLCVRNQNSAFTPQNDATVSPGTGSNYFHVVYLGPQ